MIALAADSTYRWIRDEKGLAAYTRFWEQLAIWLARQEETDSNIRVKLKSRRFLVGDNYDAILHYNCGRGHTIPGLNGVYLYSDNCKPTIVGAVRDGNSISAQRDLGNVPNITSFGEDPNGELYGSILISAQLERLLGLHAQVALWDLYRRAFPLQQLALE